MLRCATLSYRSVACELVAAYFLCEEKLCKHLSQGAALQQHNGTETGQHGLLCPTSCLQMVPAALQNCGLPEEMGEKGGTGDTQTNTLITAIQTLLQ